MTKDQLLAKGVKPDVADEILSSFGAGEDESPLLALNKALKGANEAESTLFKSEDGDEDDEDGDSDPEEGGKKKGKKGSDDDEDEEEAYMKKGEEYEDMEKEEKKMKKAHDSLDLDNAGGGVVEMADLTDFLGSMTNFARAMTKAVGNLRAENRTIKTQNAELYSLMHKASAVQALTAEALGQTLSQSTGRKGVNSIPAKEMAKAAVMHSDTTLVYQTLAKAMSAGDQKAGFILSAFESAGKRLDMLDGVSREYISTLLNKGE